MKRFILTIGIAVACLLPTAAGASSYWTQYNAVYGLGGSYWVAQQQAQQNYWNSYNAVYGPGGWYCVQWGWGC